MSGSQISNNIVSVALSQAMGTAPPPPVTPQPAHTPQPFALSSSNGSPVVIQPSHEYSFQNSPAASAVTVDLPSLQQTVTPQHAPQTASNTEENGVLLCNLDDLSRYIPENFYSDFSMTNANDPNHVHTSINGSTGLVTSGVPDYLQTVVAGKAITTTVSASSQLPTTLAPNFNTLSPHLTLQPQQPQQPQTITFHLPTQPQPIQGVKTLTYVNRANNNTPTQVSHGKITQYAYTPSGERIAITGISAEATKPGSTVQVQVKGGGYQTLQLTPIEPNSAPTNLSSPGGQKLTVVQELPDVVIQEAKPVRADDIHSILEDMKQENPNPEAPAPGMTEYTTAIPVAVTSLASDPKRTTIKRVAAPASTVYLPSVSTGNGNEVGGAKPRFIFAGNTLPQGAIPIQINGVNTITAVKSIPLSTVISPSSLANGMPEGASTPTTDSQLGSPRKANPSIKSTNGTKNTMVTKVSNNNGGFHKIQSNNLANINKAIGNNKTCNWVFENGEVCGKTFSKSYNLVVHMRMHEDVRPFGCGLCDQTFRQKAHLQRHETTHGIGPKIGSRSSTANATGAPMPRRKRKRSARGSNPAQETQPSPQPQPMSVNLQQRLARVSEQFSNKDDKEEEDELSPEPKMRRLSVTLNRCDNQGQEDDPNAPFQPYIATPEEAAAVAQQQQPRTSPHVLDAAVTAAVNEAISDIQDSIM